MVCLKQRANQSEIMDDASTGYEEFAATLRQLSLLNCLLGAYRPTLKAIAYFLKTRHTKKKEPLRILDIGCGSGDMLREIYGWAKVRGLNLELTGVDLNPWSTRAAVAYTTPPMRIQYYTSDIFNFSEEKNYHIIINSQFTHHLSDENITQVMLWMSCKACYGWFINDLHRSFMPYGFIKAFVHMLPFNRLIRHDAPLSVARSFVHNEWLEYVRYANLDYRRLSVTWYWPFRWGVRYDI